MGNKAWANASLHTADLYTTAIRVLPVDIQDLTLLTGTGLNINAVPAENNARELLMYDVAFMANVSCYTKLLHEHAEVTSQTLYRPGADSGNSSTRRSDILDEFSLILDELTSVPDLSTLLLLLCGDVESNPGPADSPQNQGTAKVGIDSMQH